MGLQSHCINHSLFEHLTTLNSPIIVHLPDGTTNQVTQVGNIHFSKLKLTEALFSPNFSHNLLYVKKLITTNSVSCIFYPCFCILQDLRSEKILAVGRVVGNLYCLDQFSFSLDVLELFNTPDMLQKFIIDSYKSSLFSAQVYANTSSTYLHIWYSRLGHPSDIVLHQLPFIFDLKSHDHKCYICPMAKQTRISFQNSFIQTKQAFDLVHMDIWGPHHTTSLSGANYFLTLVDDFTRATWAYLMTHKSQTCAILTKFATLVQNQFNITIKMIKSDNGS